MNTFEPCKSTLTLLNDSYLKKKDTKNIKLFIKFYFSICLDRIKLYKKRMHPSSFWNFFFQLKSVSIL